jgi:hypothetical protein
MPLCECTQCTAARDVLALVPAAKRQLRRHHRKSRAKGSPEAQRRALFRELRELREASPCERCGRPLWHTRCGISPDPHRAAIHGDLVRAGMAAAARRRAQESAAAEDGSSAPRSPGV